MDNEEQITSNIQNPQDPYQEWIEEEKVSYKKILKFFSIALGIAIMSGILYSLNMECYGRSEFRKSLDSFFMAVPPIISLSLFVYTIVSIVRYIKSKVLTRKDRILKSLLAILLLIVASAIAYGTLFIMVMHCFE